MKNSAINCVVNIDEMFFCKHLDQFFSASVTKKHLLATFPPLLSKFRYLATIVVSLTPFRQTLPGTLQYFPVMQLLVPG